MREQHLSEERLIDLCVDQEPAAAERRHLERCVECQQRHTTVLRMLAEVSAAANTAADAVFTPDRLRKQQARVLHRIEREGQPGRLLVFPAGHAHGPTLRSRPATRWIVGAAVAGLVIGLVAGHLPHDLPRRSNTAAQIAARPAASSLQAASASALSEEEFLGLIELAVEGTSGSTLAPLDDLTPLVSDGPTQ